MWRRFRDSLFCLGLSTLGTSWGLATTLNIPTLSDRRICALEISNGEPIPRHPGGFCRIALSGGAADQSSTVKRFLRGLLGLNRSAAESQSERYGTVLRFWEKTGELPEGFELLLRTPKESQALLIEALRFFFRKNGLNSAWLPELLEEQNLNRSLGTFGALTVDDLQSWFSQFQKRAQNDLLAPRFQVPDFEKSLMELGALERVQTDFVRLLISSGGVSSGTPNWKHRTQVSFRRLFQLKYQLINFDLFLRHHVFFFLPEIDWLALRQSGRLTQLGLSEVPGPYSPLKMDLRLAKVQFAYNWLRRIYGYGLLSNFLLTAWIRPLSAAAGAEHFDYHLMERTAMNSFYLSLIRAYSAVVGLRSGSPEIQSLMKKTQDQDLFVFLNEFGAAVLRDNFFPRFLIYLFAP